MFLISSFRYILLHVSACLRFRELFVDLAEHRDREFQTKCMKNNQRLPNAISSIFDCIVYPKGVVKIYS